jgi:hypothetical protein
MYGCDPWKDKEDAIERRLDVVESKNLDQDNAIGLIRNTMPNALVVDTLTIDVTALKDEKLDNVYMDEDIHFGPITITKDGTAVIASFDAINPITGAVTPLSFTLPGATNTDAGVMDASTVAWITEAEARISALEGLSDVKAVVGLSATPTQAEINTAWMGEVGKAPETGDLVQDVSNAKLWVYVTDTWILYGTLVVVPLATTGALGGIRDTALDAPANRWYGHVEADGRLSLIGGDSLSTLLDTTVPGIQTGVNNSVKKTGNEEIAGIKTFLGNIYQKSTQDIGVAGYNPRVVSRLYDANNVIMFNHLITKGADKSTTQTVELANKDANGTRFTFQRVEYVDENKTYRDYMITPDGTWVHYRRLYADNTGYSSTPYRSYAQANNTDILTKGHVADILAPKQDKLTFDSVPTAGSANPVTSGGLYTALSGKQDKLTFDSVPTTGSTKPVTSGGIKTALDSKLSSFSLYEHTIRAWTPPGTTRFKFSLTILNQSATEFTFPTLYTYLGSAFNDYKQCSGMAKVGDEMIDLTIVRGGNPGELFFEGVKISSGDFSNLALGWEYLEGSMMDKVRQIV